MIRTPPLEKQLVAGFRPKKSGRGPSLIFLVFFVQSLPCSHSSKMPTAHKLEVPLYVVAAKRIPFGAYGGMLKTFTNTDMMVEMSKKFL